MKTLALIALCTTLQGCAVYTDALRQAHSPAQAEQDNRTALQNLRAAIAAGRYRR